MITEMYLKSMTDWLGEKAVRAAYTLNGEKKTAQPYKKTVRSGTVEVQFLLDGQAAGTVADLKLTDAAGTAIAESGQSFVKPAAGTLFLAFRLAIAAREG